MKARFVSVYCSNHLFVPTEYARMEFDFFKLYPVAVNFHLIVYSAQVKKVAILGDLCKVDKDGNFLYLIVYSAQVKKVAILVDFT